MNRRLVVTFSLVAVFVLALAMTGCSSDSEPVVSAKDQTIAPEPIQVRVEVTAAPIDTPTPTPEPVVQPQFTDEQLADPVFPAWLDPELNAEQPEDEAVFEGWNEYFTNTLVHFTNNRGAATSRHFCTAGILADPNEVIDERFLWGVTRTASMSSSQWGQVALTAEVLSGSAEAGRTITVFVISREGGKLFQTGSAAPLEMKIERSTFCLDLAAAN